MKYYEYYEYYDDIHIFYENVLTCDVLHKSLTGANCFHIMFNKADGIIRGYDGNKFLVTFI